MLDPHLLERIPLFDGLPASIRTQLAAKFHERQYQRGALIFSEGEPGETACFVYEGRVKVYKLSPDGQEQLMGFFGPGQPFGLVSSLDQSPYPASAAAVVDSRIWTIRSEYLQPLMTEHPGFSAGLLQAVGSRLRRAQSRVHSLATRSVQQRLAEHLLEQIDLQKAKREKTGSVQIQLTMTHQELGSYLGASRETITRALADLRRDGAIRVGDSTSLILFPEQLRSWLES